MAEEKDFGNSDLKIVIEKLSRIENVIFKEIQVKIDDFKEEMVSMVNQHLETVEKNIKNFNDGLAKQLENHEEILAKHEESIQSQSERLIAHGDNIFQIKTDLMDIKNKFYSQNKESRYKNLKIIAILYLIFNIGLTVISLFFK